MSKRKVQIGTSGGRRTALMGGPGDIWTGLRFFVAYVRAHTHTHARLTALIIRVARSQTEHAYEYIKLNYLYLNVFNHSFILVS